MRWREREKEWGIYRTDEDKEKCGKKKKKKVNKIRKKLKNFRRFQRVRINTYWEKKELISCWKLWKENGRDYNINTNLKESFAFLYTDKKWNKN